MEHDPSLSPDPVTADQIDRYLAGHMDSPDAIAVAAYLADHPGVERYHRTLAVQLGAGLPPESVDPEAAFQAWEARMDRAVAANPAPRPIRSERGERLPLSRSRHPRAAYLAGLVIAAALCVIVPSIWRGQHGAQRETQQEYATPRAASRTVTLADGSVVVLAPETKLTYRTDHSGARTVDLQGQAFFTISHASTHPFVVRTGAVETRVLGTSFDVRHYATDAAVQVAVATGKVATRNRGKTVILTPGMSASMTDSSTIVREGNDLSAMTSWTQGRLVFANTPVPAALETIGRWCGYEFRLADSSLVTQTLTAQLTMTRPDEAMTLLQDILNVRMTFRGHVVILTPRRQTTRPPVLRPAISRDSFSSPSPEVGK